MEWSDTKQSDMKTYLENIMFFKEETKVTRDSSGKYQGGYLCYDVYPTGTIFFFENIKWLIR